MAYSGSRGEPERQRQSQNARGRGQPYRQTQGNGANGNSNARTFPQLPSSTPGLTSNVRPGMQAPRPQGNTGYGLRRGLTDISGNGSQRGSIPANTNSFVTSSSRGNDYGTASVDTANENQSMGFSQAFALDISIPTSKFNTEAFGSLHIRPRTNMNSGTPSVSAGAATEIITGGAHFDTDLLDDDLELPLDLEDDDFGMTDMDEGKLHGVERTIDITHGLGYSEVHPGTPVTGGNSDRIESSQMAIEAAALKQKVAELEAELERKKELLQVESGRASILKDRLEDINKSHVELSEKYKTAQSQYQSEKQSMEEKHQKDLANINMNHQFEMQRYILDGPPGTKDIKSSQQIRQTSVQPAAPVFPKSFSGFAASQSSTKIQSRDDGFSVNNFAVPPKSPRKARSFGAHTPALEKSRPFQLPKEPLKPGKTVFGFNSNVPTRSEEEIIRDKLLAGHEHTYGLRQLLSLEADEENISPLPGSQDYEKNRKLEKIAEKCVAALSNLILEVNEQTKSDSFSATTALLKASLVMRKPIHTVNALQILTILCISYESLSKELCQGAVPFFENEREDPLTVTPTENTLVSALSCVHFLFLTRMAIPIPQTPVSPFPSMRKAHSISNEAEDLLEANIFLLLNLSLRQHLETKSMSRIFVPLVRLRIYKAVMKICLEKRRFESLDRALDLLELIVRDTDCSKILVGWSISKMGWTDHFPHIDTFIDIIDLKAEDSIQSANGQIPRLKIKAFEILDRIVKCNLEQTDKFIQQTQLVFKVIHSIQCLVELAGEIHHKRKAGSIWKEKNPRPTNGFNRHPSSPGSSHSLAIITPKTEPGLFPSSAQSKNIQQRQGSPVIQRTINVIPSTQPSEPSPPPSPPKSLFTSFKENYSDNAYYKPLGLDKFGYEGGIGSRQIMQFLYPDNIVFDFMVLLKLELEFILGIVHALPEYRIFLFNKGPNEYRALAFAVTRIYVCELGLPQEAKDLALEVLGFLMIHDEEEPYYIELVKEMYGIQDEHVE